MTKAKRGLWSYRFACISLVGALGLALSACGGDSGSASTGPTTSPATSSTGSTSTGSTSTGTNGTSVGSGSGTVVTNNTNVTLGWTPPTENSDGTPLTDLAGYKIHYGTASQAYTQTISLANPGLASYVVDNLPAGTYYFAVTAYNSAGTESLLSDEVAATLN